MSFTREDMTNIRSCIKKRGTKSQRRALEKWEKTNGYVFAISQFERLLSPYRKKINLYRTKESYTYLFLKRHDLLSEYEKEIDQALLSRKEFDKIITG